MPDIVVSFFILGLLAGLLRSDLRIPKATYETLSLLLMLTIGLKGGMALYGHLNWGMVPQLLGVAAIGAVIPVFLVPVLRKVVGLDLPNSASIAAHYGSVSAGTFAVVMAFTESRQMTVAPESTLYLVMMELPAIIAALLIYRARRQKLDTDEPGPSVAQLWHESLTNKGVVLLAGGVIIGFIYGPANGAPVTELLTGAFQLFLAFFLLEMGLVAANTLRPFPAHHWRLVLFALIAPVVLAVLGLLAAEAMGMEDGTALIVATITASASYIAAPAAIKSSVKDADIGLAMLASLGVTFPFNVIIGIELYHRIQTAGWFF
ncbi:MAG: sodium-dependent bicarbonate transport family permease [Pseudomonadota bacterium]